jgi:ribosomal protein L7/L12
VVLPKRLTIHGSGYYLDGGTTILQGTDDEGREHSIMLVQHAFPQAGLSLNAIPGRLYFDGRLISMRSELEAQVVQLLRTAEVRYVEPVGSEFVQDLRTQLSPKALILGDDIRQVLSRGPEENMRAHSAAIVQFVLSDDYFRFAERVEQAADSTLYTVWVGDAPAERSRTLVRLGRILGIGLQGAREFLDRGTPLAENISATEAAKLLERYAPEKLSLRIEPAFRWQRINTSQ